MVILLFSLLIEYVADPQVQNWKGYLYAIILTLTAMVQTVFNSQYFHRMYVVGFQVRTAAVSAIYRKVCDFERLLHAARHQFSSIFPHFQALTMTSSARKDSTVGEVVNLMAVDAQRLMDLTAYVNLAWSSPLQIALSIYFLYDIIGVAVFAGLAVMILLVPVNGFLANATKKLQIKQMKNKDKRVKMMNEILSGMKVMK